MRLKISLQILPVFSNWNISLEITRDLLKVKIIYLHSLFKKCKEYLHLMKFPLLSRGFKYLRTLKLRTLEGSLTTTSKFCNSSTEILKMNDTHSIVFLSVWIRKSQKLLKNVNKSNLKSAASENLTYSCNNNLCNQQTSQQVNTSCMGPQSKLID
jgi:hypothetical protein